MDLRLTILSLVCEGQSAAFIFLGGGGVMSAPVYGGAGLWAIDRRGPGRMHSYFLIFGSDAILCMWAIAHMPSIIKLSPRSMERHIKQPNTR